MGPRVPHHIKRMERLLRGRDTVDQGQLGNLELHLHVGPTGTVTP